MKLKVIITMLVIMFGAITPSFAAFPVQSTANNTEVVNEANDNEFFTPAASGGKSQIVATLLCWLVGIIGIHRFYLGYTWQGIVQILTLGGLGIWTLIDLIRIIMGTLQPKDGAYEKTF